MAHPAASRATLIPSALTIALLIVGCAPASPSASSNPAGAAQPSARKRTTLAASASLVSVSGFLAVGGTGSNLPGTGEVEKLLNAGLTSQSSKVAIQPQLAEVLPTTENGLWVLLPDGRMETTWKIRPNVVWHDGTPFTTQDLLFTYGLKTDRALAVSSDPVFAQIEGVDAVDARTLLVRWKAPYIDADKIFAGGSLPLPRHLLERPYTENKETFPSLGFWSRDYVGTGPYKLKEFAEGSHALLEANPDYFLGKPKIDDIEVKFIPDPNTIVANVLAGAVDMTLSRGVSIEQASQVRNRGWNGRVEVSASNPNHLAPQHGGIREPAVIGDVPFRRALLEAIDREEMAAALTSGLGPIAHSGLPYGDPQYAHAEAGAVRYQFDARRAAQAIESMGYSRTPDGKLVDRGGAPLAIELRSTEKDTNVKTIQAAADYWRRIGIAAETTVIPAAMQANTEYYLSFKGFQTGGPFGSLGSLQNLKASEIPSAQNSFRGRNTGQYVNAELESLVQRYITTIPLGERMETLRSITQHMSGNLVTLYLYYEIDPALIADRLLNVSLDYYGDAYLWDVK